MKVGREQGCGKTHRDRVGKQLEVHTKLPTLKEVSSPGNEAGLMATEITAQFWHPDVTCLWKYIYFQERRLLYQYFFLLHLSKWNLDNITCTFSPHRPKLTQMKETSRTALSMRAVIQINQMHFGVAEGRWMLLLPRGFFSLDSVLCSRVLFPLNLSVFF